MKIGTYEVNYGWDMYHMGHILIEKGDKIAFISFPLEVVGVIVLLILIALR